MNTENVQNVGASQEAVVAQGTNSKISFAEKAKKVAFGTITVACTVSAVTCAACRVIRLIRLIRGDEK